MQMRIMGMPEEIDKFIDYLQKVATILTGAVKKLEIT